MRWCLLVLLTCNVMACGELPPVDVVTDELEIGTHYAYPLCEGDLQYLDRHVREVERVLDADADERVRVYLFEELPEGGCSEHAASCYKPREDYIIGTWFYIEHEIVHAVMSRVGKPERFFNEGLAEALSGRRTQFGRTRPTENLSLRAGQQDYPMAGHFMRWLGESYGNEALRALVRSSDDRRGRQHAFDSIHVTYGSPMGYLEQEFYSEAPWSFPGLTWCDYPEIEQSEAGGWDLTTQLRCSDETTYSSGRHGIYTIRTFGVPRKGTYNLALRDNTHALVWRCQSRTLWEPDNRAPSPGVGTEPGGRTWWRPLWLSPDKLHELELEQGQYRIELFLPEEQDGVVGAKFERKLGPIPVVPGD